jgi:hypothetical protein
MPLPPWLTLLTRGRARVSESTGRPGWGRTFSAAGCRVRPWAGASLAGRRRTPASRAGSRNRP